MFWDQIGFHKRFTDARNVSMYKVVNSTKSKIKQMCTNDYIKTRNHCIALKKDPIEILFNKDFILDFIKD